ncbi:MAG: hypothetical protein Kapaf2KO_19960 [Candidatus Kapaibacteriales bacterium]
MPGRFGDLVLATFMLNRLAEFSESGKIDLITGAKNHAVLKNEPYIGELLVLDKSPAKLVRFLFKLNQKEYELFIDPKDHPSKESKIIARFVKASEKLGYIENHNGFDRYIRSLPDIKSNLSELPEQKHHFTLRMTNVLTDFGYDQNELIEMSSKGLLKPSLTIGDESRASVDNYLSNKGVGSYFVLNLSASAEHRYPDAEFWEKFLKSINIKYPIIITYAPSEKVFAAELLERLMKIDSLKIYDFGLAEFSDIVALIKGSELLISPDTAVVHVAAAFNVPIFAFFSWYEKHTKAFYPMSSQKYILWSREGDKGVRSIEADEAIRLWEKEIEDKF